MLEDDFNDCLSKAIRGHGCTVAQLARITGIHASRIIACLDGHEDLGVLHQLSPHLQLNAEKLIALKNYQPTQHGIAGLTQVTSAFGHLGVNAYIVQLGEICLIFDTGTDSTELHAQAPQPSALLITHSHADHTAGIGEFSYCQVIMPASVIHGDILRWGELRVKALDVSGHDQPARAYFITGLAQPVCIVGDAIFAGSIGKCADVERYTLALANIRDHLLTLPKETILCPGHGPLTTVEEELKNNPFF